MKQLQQMTPVGTKTTFVEVWKWGQELERLHARIAPRFARPEPHLAEHAGESRPDGMQYLLNNAVWDADLVRDDLRAYILEQLSDPHAMLVIDESSFRKRVTIVAYSIRRNNARGTKKRRETAFLCNCRYRG